MAFTIARVLIISKDQFFADKRNRWSHGCLRSEPKKRVFVVPLWLLDTRNELLRFELNNIYTMPAKYNQTSVMWRINPLLR